MKLKHVCARPLLLVAALVLLTSGALAQKAYTLKRVPNPKASPSWDYVSDPDGIIGAAHEATINGVLKRLEDSTGIQIAVVALGSIGDESAEAFATELGEYWGVGQAESDNGALLLLVMDQKRWQIATGYGLEAILPDALVVGLGEEVMVPYFRQGEFGEGMAAYAVRLAGLLTDSTARAAYIESHGTYHHPTHSGAWLGYAINYLWISVAFSFLAWLVIEVQAQSADPYKAYQRLRPATWWLWAILFFFPYVLVRQYASVKLKALRNKPRNSPKTGRLMVKLGEKEDDTFLEAGQRTEEKIKSIDYDVWVVPDDPKDILILTYASFYSSYFKCTQCGYKTGFSVSRTITPATYTSSGRGQKTTQCKHCKYSKTTYYTIPQKVESSSSSGSSGSSFSSGGSSFGGGSFGGGGGGGSW